MSDLEDGGENIDELIAFHEHLEQQAHLLRDYTKVSHHQKMQQILRALKKHKQETGLHDLD